MKNLLLTLLLIPSFIFAQSKGFTISGNIAGLSDGEVKIAALQGDQVVATGTAKNGIFSVKGSIAEPGLYWITLPGEQAQYIFLENSSLKISGAKKDIKNIKIEGSKSHKEFLEFQKVFNPVFGELNFLVAELQKANDQKKPELMNKYNAAVKNLNAEVTKFVSKNKSSFVSPFLLFTTASVAESPMELEKRFNILDEKIRNTEVGKNLYNYIQYSKIGSIGSEALDFTQADTAGRPVKLSDFKGRYVLVDFWASWCRPCRVENPTVVKAFEKFRDKNFTVLGVSLDSNKDSWIKAIKDDKLAWAHVSDLQQWNNAVAVMYHVQSIPQNFLIGPDGKIVAKDLRGPDLEKKLCELLGCN